MIAVRGLCGCSPIAVPEEGGIKVVFDVLESEVARIATQVRAAGFDVRRRYQPADEHQRGGSAYGWIRLGAARPLTRFTQAEQDAVVAEFDLLERDFDCERVGTDVWTAGGGGSGVREPRRPRPLADQGAAQVYPPR